MSKIYTNENIQEKIENNNDVDLLNLPIENNGKKVIGVLQIDKIDFNGLVYEGTDLDTLKIGVGHFLMVMYVLLLIIHLVFGQD